MGNSLLGDGTPVVLRAMGVAQAGANPNSAKLMLDFILSSDGQTKIGEGGLTAYRPDVADKTKNHLAKLAATIGEQNLIPTFFDPDFKDKAKKDAFVARWKKAIGKP
jgi:iron(III) transport system substrate-binding protein